MTTFSRRERTETTVEYIVPSPTPWAEVDKAAVAAWREFRNVHSREPAENEIVVVSGGDEIIVRFLGGSS